jgi:hypothetical protein
MKGLKACFAARWLPQAMMNDAVFRRRQGRCDPVIGITVSVMVW